MGKELILEFFCPECKVTALRDHPDNERYKKCTFCGFTEPKRKTKERVKELIKNKKIL